MDDVKDEDGEDIVNKKIKKEDDEDDDEFD